MFFRIFQAPLTSRNDMRDTFFPARLIPNLYPAAYRLRPRSRKPPVLVGFEHRGKSKEEW